jgi:hypothetical protein
MKKMVLIVAVAVCFLGGAGTVLAHHSLSWADNEHPVNFTGTVTAFLFENPHSQIMFDVTQKDGTIEHWMVEIGGPPGLHRDGWTAETLKPGDVITVEGGAAKDGRKIINSHKMLINGKPAPKLRGDNNAEQK